MCSSHARVAAMRLESSQTNMTEKKMKTGVYYEILIIYVISGAYDSGGVIPHYFIW
jgi:hypothetical protein